MRICGVDEAGRGPLAGPVVAAAVILPKRYSNSAIRDSKVLTAEQRTELSKEIKAVAIAWAVVAVGPRRIELLNILGATKAAMCWAVVKVRAEKALIDGNQPIAITIPQKTIVGGDATVQSIAAASILAKTARDELMLVLSKIFPGYGFERHMGYPTPEHRKAISVLGPCRIHRRTFSGVREYFGGTEGDPSQLLLPLAS